MRLSLALGAALLLSAPAAAGDLENVVAARALERAEALAKSLGLSGFSHFREHADAPELSAEFGDELGPVIYRRTDGSRRIGSVEARLDPARLAKLKAELPDAPVDRLAASFAPEVLSQLELARIKDELAPLKVPNYVAVVDLEKVRVLYEAAAARALWSAPDAPAPAAAELGVFNAWATAARGGEKGEEAAQKEANVAGEVRVVVGERGLVVEGKASGDKRTASAIRESAEVLAETQGSAGAIRDAARSELRDALRLLEAKQDDRAKVGWLARLKVVEAHGEAKRGDWRGAEVAFESAAAFAAKAGAALDVEAVRRRALRSRWASARDRLEKGDAGALEDARGLETDQVSPKTAALLADALAEQAASHDFGESQDAIGRLLLLGPRPEVFAALRLRLDRNPGAIVRAYERLGRPADAEFAAAAKSPKAATRDEVYRSLWRVGAYPDAIAALRAGLSDPDKKARASAIWALGQARLLTLDDLGRLLKDKDPWARSRAVGQAGYMYGRAPEGTLALMRVAAADPVDYVSREARAFLEHPRDAFADSEANPAMPLPHVDGAPTGPEKK